MQTWLISKAALVLNGGFPDVSSYLSYHNTLLYMNLVYSHIPHFVQFSNTSFHPLTLGAELDINLSVSNPPSSAI